MAKYEYITVAKDGAIFVFVTRGRSKPFSIEEMEDFIDNKYERPTHMPDETNETFEPTNLNIFLQDLKLGFPFCSRKYGVSEAVIRTTAAKVLPHMNLDVITRQK